MKTSEAAEYFGNKTKLAKALGISQSAVVQWGEKVPIGQAYRIEKLTDGAIKVEDDPLFKTAS